MNVVTPPMISLRSELPCSRILKKDCIRKAKAPKEVLKCLLICSNSVGNLCYRLTHASHPQLSHLQRCHAD